MNALLQFQDVSYSYPHQKQPAIENFSFSLQHGEFLGILGADNAGKSTIAKLTNGLIMPSKGQMTLTDAQGEEFILFARANDAPLHVFEESNTEKKLRNFRQRIGVVFPDPENQIVGTTVEEDVAFGLGNLQVPSKEMRARVHRYLTRVGLLHYAKHAPHTLSGGEQQKLCIAGILAMEPECLVLDEPMSFLDRRSRNEILEFLYELNTEGKTILYLTSDPEELVFVHRILLLSQGTIRTECSPSALWNNPAILEEIGILPPDSMVFRAALQQQGYCIQGDSFTPEAIVHDIT